MITHKNKFNDPGRVTRIRIEIVRDEDDNPIPNVDLEYEVGRIDANMEWVPQGVHHFHFDDAPAKAGEDGVIIPASHDATEVILGLRTRAMLAKSDRGPLENTKKLKDSIEEMLIARGLVDRPV